MLKTSTFQQHIVTSSPSTTAWSMKHHFIHLRNNRLHRSNIKFNLHVNYLRISAKAGNSDDSKEAPIQSNNHLPNDRGRWVLGIYSAVCFLASLRFKVGNPWTLVGNLFVVVASVETVAGIGVGLVEVVIQLKKLADEREKRVHDNSKLKQGAESIENLPKQTEQTSEDSQLIHQVQKPEQKKEENIKYGL